MCPARVQSFSKLRHNITNYSTLNMPTPGTLEHSRKRLILIRHNTLINRFYLTEITSKLDLMFMKHYAPNRCLYIKVAKLRTGVGSAETSYLQNCSVKQFKEHFKVQLCKGRLFEKKIFSNQFPHHPLSADQVRSS